MTTELQNRLASESSAEERRRLDSSEVHAIGRTAFEALAEDSEAAIETPDGSEDFDFTMSVTRLGDGQTVPDER